jgi:hypothetical protein
MIEVIEGRGVGAGKSYMLVGRLLSHWLQGGTCCVSDTVVIHWDAVKAFALKRHRLVLEDDQYRKISSADLARLHEVTPPGTEELPVLLAVDEAQGAFNARDWSDKTKRPFFDWLCQSRHDDNDVIILSQSQANIDKQIRRLCTYIWITRNACGFPLLGVPMGDLIRWFTFGLHDGKLFRWTQLDQDGRTPLSARWVHFTLDIGNLYKSKSMALAHRREGEAVARKKLERVGRTSGKKTMIKYVALGLLIAFGFVGYKLMNMSPGKAVAAKHLPVSSKASEAKTADLPGIAQYELQIEPWRSVMGGTVRTDHGSYTAGKMSRHGFVEVIAEGVIRYRSPAGKLGYVVTE